MNIASSTEPPPPPSPLTLPFSQAADRGAVIGGGSAGAICWFDGGHSDSFDPDTFKGAMLREFGDEQGRRKDDEVRTF